MTKLDTLISTVVLDEAYFDMTSNYYVLNVLLKSLKSKQNMYQNILNSCVELSMVSTTAVSIINIDPDLLPSNPILWLKSACLTLSFTNLRSLNFQLLIFEVNQVKLARWVNPKKIVSGFQRDEKGGELLVHRFFDARRLGRCVKK